MGDCSGCSQSSSCNVENKAACGVEGTNSMNNIKHIIGVMSGKGGVGKSTVSANLANALLKQGYKVGILDADITGPSIPRIVGIEDKRALMYPEGLRAVETDNGLKVMSLNLLIDAEDTPVIWKGPMITNTVKQFYQDVIWEELDYLIVDMPPGTGDVTLTVMQTFPLDGMVVVSVPQDMVSMIVAKAINMAKKLNINVLGVIENMSYITCPDCDKKIKLFAGDNTDKFITDHGVKLLGELPMMNDISYIDDASEETLNKFKDISKIILDDINK